MDFSFKVEGFDQLTAKMQVTTKLIQAEVNKALYASAQHVVKEVKQSLRDGNKSGRIYNRRSTGKIRGNAVAFVNGKVERQGAFRGGFHRASAAGEAPASDTGRLINSVIARFNRIAGNEAFVYIPNSLVKYAKMLEFGTSKMAARPFFYPAFERSKEFIQKRLNQAVSLAIAAAAKKK